MGDFEAVAAWGMLIAIGLSAATMITGRRISRPEGLLLLAVFFGFALVTL